MIVLSSWIPKASWAPSSAGSMAPLSGMLTTSTTQAVSLLSSATSVGSILAADAIGSGLIYMIGCKMGEIYARELDLHHQLSSCEEPNTFSFGKFWNHVKVKNENRCIPRVSAKVLGALVLLLSGQFKGGSIDALPTIKQIIVFTCWYGSMGLLDEFDDLEGDMKTSTSRKFEKWSQVGLVLPIPFLMVMNPPLYVSFALYQLIAHSLSGKIDSKYFQWTAALGLCCIILVARATKIAFPILGIALLSLSNSVWQIHDEHPMLIGLTRKIPIMNKLWDALSMHSCMVILICFKLLPLSWLSVTSTSYAISKLGIAHGSLASGHGDEVD